jgi:hypothetical protein
LIITIFSEAATPESPWAEQAGPRWPFKTRKWWGGKLRDERDVLRT